MHFLRAYLIKTSICASSSIYRMHTMVDIFGFLFFLNPCFSGTSFPMTFSDHFISVAHKAIWDSFRIYYVSINSLVNIINACQPIHTLVKKKQQKQCWKALFYSMIVKMIFVLYGSYTSIADCDTSTVIIWVASGETDSYAICRSYPSRVRDRVASDRNAQWSILVWIYAGIRPIFAWQG